MHALYILKWRDGPLPFSPQTGTYAEMASNGDDGVIMLGYNY
jgi:hypothetical protein